MENQHEVLQETTAKVRKSRGLPSDALNHTAEVWRAFRSWLRTIRPGLPPSELVVAHALRSSLPGFSREEGLGPEMTKILRPYLNPARAEDPG
jgi:hypothetical protein